MKNIRIFLAIQLFWILAFIVGIVLRKTSLFYIAFSIGFVASLISMISAYKHASSTIIFKDDFLIVKRKRQKEVIIYYEQIEKCIVWMSRGLDLEIYTKDRNAELIKNYFYFGIKTHPLYAKINHLATMCPVYVWHPYYFLPIVKKKWKPVKVSETSWIPYDERDS